jgi:hypothetical protein
MRTFLVGAGLALALIGCTNAPRTGFRVRWDYLPKLQAGVSTEAEVRQIMGRPTGTMVTPEGELVLYWRYTPVSVGVEPEEVQLCLRFDQEGKLVAVPKKPPGRTGEGW